MHGVDVSKGKGNMAVLLSARLLTVWRPYVALLQATARLEDSAAATLLDVIRQLSNTLEFVPPCSPTMHVNYIWQVCPSPARAVQRPLVIPIASFLTPQAIFHYEFGLAEIARRRLRCFQLVCIRYLTARTHLSEAHTTTSNTGRRRPHRAGGGAI